AVKSAVSGKAPDEDVGGARSRMSALDLASAYLSYVKQMILEQSNLEVDPDEPLEVMVAVPAQSSSRQRYLTMEAFRRAGFQLLGLLNEPTAAALEYAHHSPRSLSARSPKSYVVVYDLGGGTFDTAAVSLKNQSFELISSEGVSSLGGNDFDDLIAGSVLSECGIAGLADTDYIRLLERCRRAKESLLLTSRRILIDTSEILEEDEVVLSLGVIESLCEPLIEKTIESVRALFENLRKQGIDPDNTRELGAVYLVGGSVNFPPVLKRLRREFGRKLQLAPQSHASTAVGLAIAADSDSGVAIREASTRHFGVWREGADGVEKIFDPILDRHSGLQEGNPLKVERVYHPAHSVGCLRFVECTQLDHMHTPGGEVTPWDHVLFPYDPELKKEEDLHLFLEAKADAAKWQEIVETYDYEPNGLIRVAIENRTSGYRREYILE
ncbi:MAG: Hsp70 family protein, partial [Polyangiaceae bacterium]|nr:Hsp70 family protein [Polyangiaceae bacterium]